MDIIQEFITKYNGNYQKEELKSAHTPFGKYTSQWKKGTLNFNGSKIRVSINETGGATPTSAPLKMKLYMDTPSLETLMIFPRSSFSKLLRSLTGKKITAQYKFSGSRQLIGKLKSDLLFIQLIENESICMYINRKQPNIITLSPSFGPKNVIHLEKLAKMLNTVESHVTALAL